MSSTSNIQNVLSNVVRPVYVYDPATSNYSAKVIISNVDTFSVKTIEVENLEFGDANSNVYLGIDAGSENSNSRRNVGVGVGAAQNNVNTKNSVFVGYAAGGENITDASASVVLGASTLSGGSSNVYVGFGTGSSASNASGNIFLGPNLTMAIPLSNEIRIGNGSNIPFSANMNNRYIGLNTATPNYELDVSADTANFQGDVRITGSLRVAGSGGLESAQPSAVELGNGDTATGSGNLSTISFQSNTGGYRHMIRSRHDASSSPTTTNAVDIFVNTSATATGSSQPGTGNVLGLSVTAAGVGVGVSNPAYALDVSGTVRAGAIVTSGGATTLGDVVLSNGTVKLYDGSSNAPTLTFQNDTSLGLYRSGANMLTVASAGSNRMTFSNANVGIGTLNPAYSLDVCGIVRATGFIGTSGSGSSGGVVFSNGGVALSNGTVSDPALTFQSDLSLGMYRIGANQVGFVSAGSNRMTISNGNVGIGTTTPQILLDLSSATADQGITITAVNAQVNLSNPGVAPLQLYNNGSTQGLFTNNVLPLSLWTNGGRRLNILSNGNVGIGFTDASHALDVNGTTRSGSLITRNLYASSLSNSNDVSSIAYISMGTGVDGVAGSPVSNLQFLWFRSGGGPYRYSGINFGSFNTGSFLTYNQGSSLVTKYIAALPNAQSQLDACANILTITTGGLLGLGTNSPGYTLDVCESVGVATRFITAQFRNTNASGQAAISVTGGGIADTSGLRFFHNPGQNIQGIYNSNLLPFHIYTNDIQRLTILSNGFVGIGTTAPLGRLHIGSGAIVVNQIGNLTANTDVSMIVEGSSNVGMYLQKGNDNNSAGLSFKTAVGGVLGERMRINGATGFVGIGTTGPASILDISGAPNAGVFFANDGSNSLRLSNGFINIASSGAVPDPTNYGAVQVTRPAAPGDNRFHYSIIRSGNAIGGFGYQSNTNRIVIGHTNTTSSQLVIDSNVGIGIGTAAPATALDVCATNQVLTLTSTATTSPTPIATVYQPNLTTTSPSNYTYQLFGVNASSSNSVAGLFTYVGSGSASNSYRMYIQGSTGGITMRADGNVGIGTTAPIYTLDVSCGNTQNSMIVTATTYPRITLTTSHTDPSGGTILYDGTVSGNRFMLRTSGGTPITFESPPNSERMRLTSGGNLGIGTTTPAARLDIVGGDPTMIVRNTSGTSKITLVGSNGTEATGMLLTHHGTIEQAIYSSNTLPFHIYTSGLKRLTILSNGPVGIATTAPRSGFQLSSNNAGFYDAAYDSSESMHLVTHRAFRVETAAPRENHFANLYLVTDVSFTNSSVTNSAGAICFASQNSEFNGYNVAYARVSGVKVGSFYGGLSFATMHNSNDGLLRENVRIQNGQMGIGTSAPAYTLDISTAPTAASINMTTWPRTTASISYYGVYSSFSNAALIWTTSNAIDSNIMTVASNTGTYFTVNRTGLYNFSVYLAGSDVGGAAVFIDCSTSITHSAIDRTQNAIIANNVVPAVTAGGATSLTSVFTGVLPSNSGIYYKVKASSITPGTGRSGGRLVITFLGEAPAVTGFPF